MRRIDLGGAAFRPCISSFWESAPSSSSSPSFPTSSTRRGGPVSVTNINCPRILHALGSVSYILQQILLAVCERKLVWLWREHQIEKALLGQSTGVVLATIIAGFTFIVAIEAYHKMRIHSEIKPRRRRTVV
ncbi:hypothetical protein CORC01_05157 [Colletotrichum orchidophilum]|uniref:Uncharacterized protein n=1 Tax=Colletotrichum orchidophilum TaxID=1209926 RepID=A0A1G4BDP6_9PEZI|nr:uncharacterized protein CORC01_05157 [Colletotrichum orchidophilum]OHE99579.1 hypothetical protein CORC01_05157 [Colletotrichum orchidophilum]